MKVKGTSYKFLFLREIHAVLDEVYARNVSPTARGSNPEKIGFLEVYEQVDGRPTELKKIMASRNTSWFEKRNNYIKRSLAGAAAYPASTRWWKNGRPTRRHLALIVWAYSPTPKRLANYA
tara:strand:+ start:145 stop:507 length:363 start_codon:yes stop_codon:yes gene_type:complete